LILCAGLTSAALHADVSLVERKHVARTLAGTKSGDKHHQNKATGSQALIDNSGLKYFINTNITFSTSSSASGAMSEASYTHAVSATTSGGGNVSSTLNDAYDGYNTICLSLNNTVATCETGNANFVIYNKNGPATTECPGTVSGVNRQVVFPVQTSGSIQMLRKVYIPDNDAFARWLNYFTNTSGTPVTATMVVANNLGSDSNTIIVNSSSGDAVVTTGDLWATTFQNYSGTTSSDPRLYHVFQGSTSVPTPLAGVNFANGDDNPFWGYTFTLQPGETKIIANFGGGKPSKTEAANKAAQLAGAAAPTDPAWACMSQAEQKEVANFVVGIPIAEVPALSGAGLAALALALAAGAFLALRRIRRA
jgi:hypothetical protein